MQDLPAALVAADALVDFKSTMEERIVIHISPKLERMARRMAMKSCLSGH